jgi:hypothetical protein
VTGRNGIYGNSVKIEAKSGTCKQYSHAYFVSEGQHIDPYVVIIDQVMTERYIPLLLSGELENINYDVLLTTKRNVFVIKINFTDTLPKAFPL